MTVKCPVRAWLYYADSAKGLMPQVPSVHKAQQEETATYSNHVATILQPSCNRLQV